MAGYSLGEAIGLRGTYNIGTDVAQYQGNALAKAAKDAAANELSWLTSIFATLTFFIPANPRKSFIAFLFVSMDLLLLTILNNWPMAISTFWANFC